MAKSVVDAWENYLSPRAFRNVYSWLRVVLGCIVEGRGGNDLVESKRGKLFRDATIIDLTEDGTETVDEAAQEPPQTYRESLFDEDVDDDSSVGSF